MWYTYVETSSGPELSGTTMEVSILAIEEELCPVTFGHQKKRKGFSEGETNHMLQGINLHPWGVGQCLKTKI